MTVEPLKELFLVRQAALQNMQQEIQQTQLFVYFGDSIEVARLNQNQISGFNFNFNSDLDGSYKLVTARCLNRLESRIDLQWTKNKTYNYQIGYAKYFGKENSREIGLFLW